MYMKKFISVSLLSTGFLVLLRDHKYSSILGEKGFKQPQAPFININQELSPLHASQSDYMNKC